MTSRRPRTLRATVTVATAAAFAVPSVPAATAASAPNTSTNTLSGAALPAAATTVTLPTGDRLALGPQGAVTPLDDTTHTGLTGFNDGKGDRYLIPSEALPYAGHQLDMSLFDVTKLAASQNSNANAGSAANTQNTIPVQLTFQPGTTPTAPPGVTLTATAGSTATGYLTADSGKALAAALRKQIGADKAAGRALGASGLPGGLQSMALAGTTPPVTPHYPMRILQINAVDADGLPANVPILLVNTDDSRIYQMPVAVVDGIGRVAVPAGNYAAFGAFAKVDDTGYSVRDSLVTLQDFQVPATGDVPAQTVDARAATAQITVATDKPATPDLFLDLAARQPVAGPTAVAFQVDQATVPAFVTPAPKAAVGRSAFMVHWDAEGPATGPQYQYNLGFTSDHEDANQSYRPHDADLAQIVDTAAGEPWYTGLPRRLSGGPTVPLGLGPGLIFGGRLTTGVPMTGYYTPDRWVRVLNGAEQVVNGNFAEGPTLYSDPIELRRGRNHDHLWNQGPVAPGVRRHADEQADSACGGCAGAGGLNLTLSQVGDSNPDTQGQESFSPAGYPVTANYFWNGQPIASPASVPPWLGLVLPTAPTGPGTLRAVVDVDRTMEGATQSTKTHTDISFPYSGKADPAATLPAGNECLAAAAAGQPAAPCQILPVLTITYQLAGLTTTNTSQLPVQPLVLDIGHEHFGSHGPQVPVTSAQVSISTDGGATWQDVPTIGALGHYAAVWQNPAAGTSITVRVTAKDAVGGTITQTITNPYTVG